MATPVLVCIHGRGQEFKAPARLLTKWLAGLNAGLTSVGGPTMAPDRVVFPFFGDELYRVAAGLAGRNVRLESVPRDEPGPLHPETSPEVGRLERELILDMARAGGITTPTPTPTATAAGGVREEGLGERLLSWRAARELLTLVAKRSRVTSSSSPRT